MLKYPGSGIVTQFRFTCPEDKLPAMKNCNQRILGLLTTAGVGIDVIEMPERDTPEQGNKPLTDNDVTDFMFDLHYLPEISS
ncbi:hypothetical protein HYS01_01705 [Candidatus Saccharibacteria bacterium]|nr:hypothetical protein [Candidatus Saccharibacteria bacterium]